MNVPGKTLDASGFLVLGPEEGPQRRIRLWPEPVAYDRESPSEPWRETTVEVRFETPRKLLKSIYPVENVPKCKKIGKKSLPQQHLLFPDDRDLRSDLADLFYSVPERVREAVVCMGSNQWLALQHADAPGAIDAYVNSPVLATGVLLSKGIIGHSLLGVDDEIFLKSPKEIASRLGFNPIKRVMAILNKLSLEDIDAIDFITLMKAVSDPFAVKLLRHALTPVDRRFVGLLADTSIRTMMAHSVFLEIACSNRCGSLSNTARQVARYHRNLSELGEARLGRPITKVSQLQERLRRARRVWKQFQETKETQNHEPPAPPASAIHQNQQSAEATTKRVEQNVYYLPAMQWMPFSSDGWYYGVEPASRSPEWVRPHINGWELVENCGRPAREMEWIAPQINGWELAESGDRRDVSYMEESLAAVRRWIREKGAQAGLN